MNMKKLAIITFAIAVLLVPGNGHAADKDSAPLTNVTGVVTSPFGEVHGQFKHTGMDIAYSEGTLLHAPIAGNMKVISIEGKNTRGTIPIRDIVLITDPVQNDTLVISGLNTGKYKKDKVEAGDPIGMTVSDEIHVEYWVGGYHKGDAVNPSPLLILNGSDLDFRCLRKK